MGMGKFEELYGLNVNDKTEKKGNLTYLSWAWAWAEFKKAYPDANYKIERFDGTYCTGNEKIGYMVATQVSAGDQTHEMWLPVMDSRNATILAPKMTEINKTIMRCLTKNLAMFGLGLYIYAGEDLPEGEEQEQPKPVAKPQTPPTAPKTAPKTDDKPTDGWKLTKTEMCTVWGVKNVEETLTWLERKIGYIYQDWTDEEHETARDFLRTEKQRRKAEADKMRQGLQQAAVETPFDVGD
jgi:hypothetical protein